MFEKHFRCRLQGCIKKRSCLTPNRTRSKTSTWPINSACRPVANASHLCIAPRAEKINFILVIKRWYLANHSAEINDFWACRKWSQAVKWNLFFAAIFLYEDIDNSIGSRSYLELFASRPIDDSAARSIQITLIYIGHTTLLLISWA